MESERLTINDLIKNIIHLQYGVINVTVDEWWQIKDKSADLTFWRER